MLYEVITSDDAKETINNKDIPTLEQLAALDNAIPIPQIVKKVSPSVVGISSATAEGTATGTGIIMSKDGYIITNRNNFV